MTTEIKNPSPASETVANKAAEQTLQPAAEAPLVASTKATRGEKLYKWVVHGVINTAINEGIGLWFMYAGKFGADKGWAARKIYALENNTKQPIENFFKRTLRMGDETAKPFAHIVQDIFLLAMGGNLLLIPIKKLDEHKSKWVRRADELLDKITGKKELGVQEIADREAAYTRIENEIQPSWGRVLGARGTALLANMATLGTWKSYGKPDAKDRKGTNIIGGWIGDKALGEGPNGEYNPPTPDARWWINTVVLETISTAVTAAIFYVKYELIDQKLFGKKKREANAEKNAAAPAASAETVAVQPVEQSPAHEQTANTHTSRIQAEREDAPTRLQPRSTHYTEAVQQEKLSAAEAGVAL
jgi:hypothetical protein